MKEQNNFFMQFSMQTNKLWKKILLLIGLIIFSYSKTMANEEAPYDIVHKTEIYEIRHYSDRLAVQVVNKVDNNSFRKLFNYISGANNKSEKIAMTVPVTQTVENNEFYMQFYLPSKFNRQTTPIPSNPEIEITTIEEGHFAVIKYSGRSSDKNFIKHKDILEKELFKNNVLVLSQPIKATYNGPFTLPMLRRNEAMFKIKF